MGIALPTLIVSFCIATLTICELLIVSMTAATVMVILSVVHNIPIMVAGIVLYHDQVFRNQWVGFVVCSVGATMYFYARGRAGSASSDSRSDVRRIDGTSMVSMLDDHP